MTDLAPGPDGAVWALGAADRKLCLVSRLVPGAALEGGNVTCAAELALPEGLGGKVWEGLSFVDARASATDRWVLAIDRKSESKPNLAIVRGL